MTFISVNTGQLAFSTLTVHFFMGELLPSFPLVHAKFSHYLPNGKVESATLCRVRRLRLKSRPLLQPISQALELIKLSEISISSSLQ